MANFTCTKCNRPVRGHFPKECYYCKQKRKAELWKKNTMGPVPKGLDFETNLYKISYRKGGKEHIFLGEKKKIVDKQK